jgi:hypothetical protein
MVNLTDDAQLYTIEGVAAGMIMLLTAYLVLNTTSVFTPGDVHIVDMQLEQTVSDALAMMDTPDSFGGRSDLDRFVHNATNDATGKLPFHVMFTGYLKKMTGALETPVNDLQYRAVVYYRVKATNETANYSFSSSSYWYDNDPINNPDGREYIGREPAVVATRWVNYDTPHFAGNPWENRRQMLLLEVMVWRG